MLITVSMRIQKTGSLPVNSVYEFTLFFCLILLAFTVFWLIKFKINLVAVFLLFITMLLLGFSFGMSDSVTPLMPALQSNWRVSHVLTAIIAYSSFAIAFVLGLTYLISMPGKGKEEQLIQEKQERGAFLEKTMYNSVVVGFIFLTLLIVTGSIWAQDAWGAWWSWDPKETWALITWIIYAIYLHLHSKPEWKGRKGCWLAVIGFVCVMFTLFGVTFLMGGLHSY
jgi:cytochrome c-type biogenesis protein CcsB